MSERDVKELGVRNGAHRAILVSSLIVLKRKYDKGSFPNSLSECARAPEGRDYPEPRACCQGWGSKTEL